MPQSLSDIDCDCRGIKQNGFPESGLKSNTTYSGYKDKCYKALWSIFIENAKGGFNITGYDTSVLGYDFSSNRTVPEYPTDLT
jgi:hypothetical protein